jgi:hypothetical protein
MSSPTPRFMAALQRQSSPYVNPHIHQEEDRAPRRPPTLSHHNNVQAASNSGVALESRTFPADSMEGRLMSLMQQHNAHGAQLWRKRLAALEQHVRRVRFLDRSQEQFLYFVLERSRRFLRNIEDLMTEASTHLLAVDSGVLRTISASWEGAKTFVAHAEQLLVVGNAVAQQPPQHRESSAGTTRAVGTPSLQQIQMPRRAGGGVLTTPRGGSGVSMSPRPTTPMRCDGQQGNSAAVHSDLGSTPPEQRSSPPLENGSAVRRGGAAASRAHPHRPGEIALCAGSELSLSTRKDLLETIEAISFGCMVAGELTSDGLGEAKRCFASLYGPTDGHRRFTKWCDEQALGLMRSERY